MDNYYQLLEISTDASSEEIIIAYKNKIKLFNFINNLSTLQINQIKQLKIALYILTNLKLRKKYDKHLQDNLMTEISNMQSMDTRVPSKIGKSGFETNIGDRVFSLCELNKRPDYVSEFETLLRNPIQGRENKSSK